MEQKMMRFSVLTEKGHAEVRERPLPEIGPHQALVRQLACNICTTDYGQWMGLREHQGYPMAGGHEGAGVIEAVGEGVKDYKPGDFVAMAYDGCGECLACRQGDVLHCKDAASLKSKTEDGYLGSFGFADYYVRNTRSLVLMNPKLDPSCAAFLEPLATVVKGLKKLWVQPLESVAVIGAGTMGLVNAQAARALGARVIVSEIMEKKLNTARQMGFEVIDAGKEEPVQAIKGFTAGAGVDAVIIAVGADAANKQAFEMVKETDGRILFFAAGYPAPRLEIDSNTIHYRRLELIGTYAADTIDFFTAANMLNSGAVDVSKIVEPVKYKLEDIQEAFQEAATPGMYRVSVMLNE